MAEKDYLTEKEKHSIGLRLYLGGNDYGWEPYKEVKHFVLTNPEKLENFDVDTLASNFRGTGHCEWEMFMAMWMLQAARKSIDEGTECDVSRVFNTEQLACPKKEGQDYRRFKPEDAWNHLSHFFKIESDDSTTCIISLL